MSQQILVPVDVGTVPVLLVRAPEVAIEPRGWNGLTAPLRANFPNEAISMT